MQPVSRVPGEVWTQGDRIGRQGSGEVLIRADECAAEGVQSCGHELPRIGIGPAATSSMTINRPCLQIGRQSSRQEGIGMDVRADRNVPWAEGEQSSALQLVLADSIGQESEPADADQPGGQHIRLKARMNSASSDMVLVRLQSA